MRSLGRGVSPWGLLLLCSSALFADDLTGRVQLSWQDFERGGVTSDGLFQLYEVNFDRLLTEALRVRVGVRALDDASGSTLAGERRTSGYQEVEPRVLVTFRRPTLDFETLWSSVDSTSVEDPERGERIERNQGFERLRASLTYRPGDLPSLTLDGYRRRATRAEAGTAVTESAGQARLDYTWGGLHLSALGRSTQVEDTGAGFERSSGDLQGQVDLSRSLWDGRVVAGATVSRFDSDIRRRALVGSGAAVPDPVEILEAFDAIDDSPADHFDRPLRGNPLLRDGDLDRAAGVPLGPGDPDHLNLAMDFGRPAEVDEVRVVGRNPRGNPLTSGGSVTWDVYTSVDGVRWVPVLDGTQTSFDAARSFWSVTFPRRTTRRLQVVSFFVNDVETEITELEVYLNDRIPGGAPRREELVLESGRGHLNVRASERVSMTWQGLWTRSRSTPELEAATEISNSDQLLFLNWRLPSDLSLELRGELRSQEQLAEEGTSTRDYRGLTGLVRWQPGANVDTALEVTRGEDEIDGAVLDLDRVQLRAFLRPWRGLEVSIEGGRQRQDFAGGLATIDTPSAYGSVKAWLSPTLIASVHASTTRSSVRGDLPPELLVDAGDDRWYADIDWLPSSRLNLGARFGRAEGGGSSAPLQAYRLSWTPFAGGAVSLVGRYDENVDPGRDRRSRRLAVTPQWTINPKLRLHLSFQRLESTSAGVRLASRSYGASLTTDF